MALTFCERANSEPECSERSQSRIQKRREICRFSSEQLIYPFRKVCTFEILLFTVKTYEIVGMYCRATRLLCCPQETGRLYQKSFCFEFIYFPDFNIVVLLRASFISTDLLFSCKREPVIKMPLAGILGKLLLMSATQREFVEF